jgi:FkbM family methyltransferase
MDRYVTSPDPIIFEVGARDCEETITFSDQYPASKIFAFECNPSTLPLCRKNVSGRKNITLIEKAVSDRTGKITFYPIDPEKTKTSWKDGNPGASSLLKASGKYPIEDYKQKEVEVETVTLSKILEDYSLPRIDTLWMDIQGAELMALTGLASRLSDVRLIHTEIEFLEIYSGQPLFKDIYNFLVSKGFILVGFTNVGHYSGDAVFVNATALGTLSRIALSLIAPFRLPILKSRKRIVGLLKRLIHRKK